VYVSVTCIIKNGGHRIATYPNNVHTHTTARIHRHTMWLKVICTHTNTCTHTRKHMHTRLLSYGHVHVCTYIHIWIYIFLSPCTHLYFTWWVAVRRVGSSRWRCEKLVWGFQRQQYAGIWHITSTCHVAISCVFALGWRSPNVVPW